MAAVSAWAKPGAWALDSEENDAMERQKEKEKGYSSEDSHQSSSDFPSLSAAAIAKTSKKKKKQTFSLAEFTSGAANSTKFQPSSRSSAAAAAAAAETIVLPTGPRERSAEELDRSRGFGLRGGFGRDSRDEPRREREPREPRDSGPSRADEVDDWGATKRSVVPERRERGGGGGGGGSFFDSQSRADESDSWISKKSAPPMEPRRSSGGGRGYDMFNREGTNGVDSDSWGKKREDIGSGGGGGGGGSGGRPRLVLQPRTVPLANGSDGETPPSAVGSGKTKGANPFGEARPREEVLKEKGKDWKEIDEKLEAVKIQEVPLTERKGFSPGPREDRTERAWRKPDAVAVSPPPESAEKVEEGPEN